jgi:hypothetical protein
MSRKAFPVAVLVSIGCSVAFQEATEFDEREQAAREATSPADLPMPLHQSLTAWIKPSY